MPEKIALSLRFDLPGGTRFGPGKAALLEAIHAAGTIKGASGHLNMSYPRALKLIDEMNAQFNAPLITKSHGGAGHGGATLTETGQQILTLYKRLCETTLRATQADRAAIERLMS